MKKNTASTIILSLLLVDLLFLPRLSWPFTVPIFLLPALLVFVISTHSKREMTALLFFVAMVFLSYFNSKLKFPHLDEDNLKRALQIVTVFAYGCAINYVLVSKYVKNIIKACVFFMGGVACLYFIYPQVVSDVVLLVYPQTALLKESNLEAFRYAYILTDPNSAGYFSVMVLGIYLAIERPKNILNPVIVTSLIVVVATQSRGAILSYLLLVSYYYIITAEVFTVAVRKLIYSALFLLVVIFILDTFTGLVDHILSRFGQEVNLGGSRINKYSYLFDNMTFLPYGHGYYLELSGQEFRPHSDLIRLIVSYGIYSFVLFIYLTFPKSKFEFLIYIPFFVAFMINTIISDYRLFGIYLLGVSIIRYEHRRR